MNALPPVRLRRTPWSAHAAVCAGLVPEIAELAIFDLHGEPVWFSGELLSPDDHAIAAFVVTASAQGPAEDPRYEMRDHGLVAALEVRNERRQFCGVVVLTLELSPERSLGPEPLERTLWPALLCLAYVLDQRGTRAQKDAPGLAMPRNAASSSPAQIVST